MCHAWLSVISMCSRAFLHNCTMHTTLLHHVHNTTATIHAPRGITMSEWLCRLFQTQETNPGSLTPGSLSGLWGMGGRNQKSQSSHLPSRNPETMWSYPSEPWRKVLREATEQGQEDRQGYCKILFLGRHELMSIYLRQGINNDQSKDSTKLGEWVLLMLLTGV